MGNVTLEDALTVGLADPIGGYHMGITAENVAERHCISREEMDALAVTSHQRAARAQAEGRFKEQILPIEIKTRKGVVLFDADEHVKGDTNMETLGAMKASVQEGRHRYCRQRLGHQRRCGCRCPGDRRAVDAKGLKPLARIVAWGHAGVEPEYMGEGPIKAVPIALKRAGLTLGEIDVFEVNEAFAAQALAVIRELGSARKDQPERRGISLGHPSAPPAAS